jgi:hypothetical protein
MSLKSSLTRLKIYHTRKIRAYFMLLWLPSVDWSYLYLRSVRVNKSNYLSKPRLQSLNHMTIIIIDWQQQLQQVSPSSRWHSCFVFPEVPGSIPTQRPGILTQVFAISLTFFRQMPVEYLRLYHLSSFHSISPCINRSITRLLYNTYYWKLCCISHK